MMELRDSFNETLAEFGQTLDAALALQDGHCSFTVDGTVSVQLEYLDESNTVIAWSTIGIAPEDGYQYDRARFLLALNELGAANDGFSFGLDPNTRHIIAHDHRPAELFDSADRLAAWLESLVEIVTRIRHEFAVQFPCADIDENEEE
ncbi:MAG: type III secretion system chaperone [Victivallales bacterium]|nr:type III secretion system chaperone [Victivallales bacterium]